MGGSTLETHTLEANARTMVGKRVKQIRKQGQVPAILYGSGIEPVPIALDALETARVMSGITGSTLIDLNIGDQSHKVIIRDVQRDPISREMVHVDFLKVAMDVAIRTEVPIELVGNAPAVKDYGGVLVAGLSEIEVEALPGDLPDRISVDLGVLAEIDDAITVEDLVIGKGVKVSNDPGDIIAHVIYMAEEEEEEEEEELEVLGVGAEPELVERRPGEEAEGEAEAEGEEPEQE
jgi:large subunit ribosomal protein L25